MVGILRLREAALRLPGSAQDDSGRGSGSGRGSSSGCGSSSGVAAAGGAVRTFVQMFSLRGLEALQIQLLRAKTLVWGLQLVLVSRAFRNESGRNEPSRSESGGNGPGSGL